jgi:hypothetical protein
MNVQLQNKATTPVIERVKSDQYNLIYSYLTVVRIETIKRATLSQQRRMYHLLGVLCGADNSVNF